MPFKVNTKQELELFFCHNLNSVHEWINKAQKELPQPLTSSVDIRESKTKYAPVDHNMYPAGFNNLCNKDLLHCADHFRESFDHVTPNLRRVGLLPESHTKNKYYLDHLHQLKSTIEMSDADVFIFSPDENLFGDGHRIELESFSGHKLEIHRAKIQDNEFVATDPSLHFNFQLIVLNNDQSVPFDINWSEMKVPVMPSPYAGWYQRQKISHFRHYRDTANRFCEHFGINPDLIQAHFTSVDHVDFNSKEGLDKIGSEVDSLLKTLPEGSSVFVKASQGTYGMGISVVSSGEEIISMNRKIRNKMDIGKGNLKFTSVLIQEGIETIVKYDDAPAEVTIYLINGKSSGGFMRANPLKGTQANLNAQGMVYRKLCLADVKQDCDHMLKEAVYTVLARLSVLAAAYEMKELMEKKNK